MEVKIAIVGAVGCGKSALLRRRLKGTFRLHENQRTIVEMHETIDNSVLSGSTIKMYLLDVGGKFSSITPVVAWADVIIVMYSIGDPSTFETAKSMLERIRSMTRESFPLVVVGGKCDFDDALKRRVTYGSGKILAETTMASAFIEASSKTGAGVSFVFEIAAQLGIAWRQQPDDALIRITPLVQGLYEKAGKEEELAAPFRRLLKDDVLVKLSAKNANKRSERRVLVTSDYFIYFKPVHASGALNVARVIPMYRVLAISVQKEEIDFCFDVIDLETKRVVTFCCRSDNDKQEWLDSFEDAISKFSCDPRRKPFYEVIRMFQTRIAAGKRVFGIPIMMLWRQTQKGATKFQFPSPLQSIVDCLRLGGHLREPGIFFLPGPSQKIKQLRGLLNSGSEVEYSAFDPHTVAWLAVSFLQQQQLPIFPFMLVPIAKEAIQESESGDKVSKLRDVMTHLPKDVFMVLAELMKFIKLITSYSEYNKIKPAYIARTFAPLVFHDDSSQAMELLLTMVDNNAVLFAPIQPPSLRSPAPPYLVKFNNDTLQGILSKLKQIVVSLLESLKSRKRLDRHELETPLQEALILINSLLDYDVSFAKEPVDTSLLDSAYFIVNEVEKLSRDSKRSGSGFLTIKLNASKRTSTIGRLLSQLKPMLEAFTSYLDGISSWSQVERSAYLKSKKDSKRTLEVQKAVGLTEDSPIREALKALQLGFVNSEAREFWQTHFDSTALSVELSAFITALATYCSPDLDKSIIEIIERAVDPRETAVVSIQMFNKFIASFGPIRECAENIKKLASEPWFCGYIPADYARKLLISEPVGTYLVRFSDDIHTAFVLEFVVEHETKEVKSLRILNSRSGTGFVVEDDTAEIYPTLSAIILALSQFATTPIQTDLFRLRYFFGELGSAESAQLLKQMQPGSFLARFAADDGMLSVDWLSDSNVVESVTLSRVTGSPKIIYDSRQFDNLEAFISSRKDVLKVPVLINDALLKKIRMAQDVKDYGPILRLVEQVIEQDDANASEVFLLTYRSFATPKTILSCLRDRFQYFTKNNNKRNRLRILSMLKLWVTDFSWDLIGDQEAVSKFREFIINDVVLDGQTIAAQLLTALHKSIQTGSTQSAASKADIEISSAPNAQANLNTTESFSMLKVALSMASSTTGSALVKNAVFSVNTPKSVIEFSPEDVAAQLSAMEQNLFHKIQPFEFFHQSWLKPDKDIRSPNLLKMIRFSNAISCWVASEILAEEQVKKRAAVLEYFVNVGKALLALNNFNGIMEILAGLGSSSINRLRKTWELFNAKKTARSQLEELRAIMDTEGNWARYRELLTTCPPPKLPYVGLILTDLVFIEEGNPDRLESGDINFVKCQRLAQTLQFVKLMQLEKYKIQPKNNIVEHILEAQKLSESEAYKRSLELEPRT